MFVKHLVWEPPAEQRCIGEGRWVCPMPLAKADSPGFQTEPIHPSPLSLQWPTCKGQLSNKCECVNEWMNRWVSSWMGESSMCMFEIVNKFKSNQKEDWMENFIVNPGLHKAQQKGADGSERKVTQRVVPSLAQEETTKGGPLLLMQDPHLQPCNFPLQASWLEISVGPEHVTLCSPRGPTDLTCH